MPRNCNLYFCGIRSLRCRFVIVYSPHVSRSRSSHDVYCSVGQLPRRYQSLGIVEYPNCSVLVRAWYARRCRYRGECAPLNSCLFIQQGLYVAANSRPNTNSLCCSYHLTQGQFKAFYVSLQVKGGGHTTNPGFSSTVGVQVAMSRFSEVVYDSTTQTATIGAGLTWDNVYAALEPYGVNVVGGRVPGVGVAGFTLGGGMFERHVLRLKETFDNINRLLMAYKSIWFDHRYRANF
jgi:hypothetical protein